MYAFTAANALHHGLQRRPTPELMRGAVHTALRINLDRFLNVPAARMPNATSGSLDALGRCFDVMAYHPYPYPFTAPELDVLGKLANTFDLQPARTPHVPAGAEVAA